MGFPYYPLSLDLRKGPRPCAEDALRLVGKTSFKCCLAAKASRYGHAVTPACPRLDYRPEFLTQTQQQLGPFLLGECWKEGPLAETVSGLPRGKQRASGLKLRDCESLLMLH